MFERLIDIRENKGCNQKDLLKILHVSKSTYSRWEKGDNIIPLKHLVTFCNHFQVTLDYTLGLKAEKSKLEKTIMIHKTRIGKKILLIRKKYNLSQKDLAIILNTTQSTISSYENGKTIILTAFLFEICNRYQVSADWMLK